MKTVFRLTPLVLLLVVMAVAGCSQRASVTWSAEQVAAIDALRLSNLKPLPPDPSNQYADDERAAAFGQKLFFDRRFSSNGAVACQTCHLPSLDFQDGKPLADGVGTTTRRTMTIVGTAYSPWLFWDGRKDSQWAQALGPMENAVEHGGNRTQYAHLVAEHYRAEYEALFGPLPNLEHLPANAGPVTDATARTAWKGMSEQDRDAVTRIYVNMGKAIAAYERKLVPGPARFDEYADAVMNGDTAKMQAVFSADEEAGLRLFIGKANCTNCHNGPLFTNNDFHNTGVPADPNLPEDTGRALGAVQVLADEFNCLSEHSDADEKDCAELRFMIAEGEELVRQYKPPSLRNVAERGPYMHAGQFETLERVLEHYSTAPDAPAGHSELEPLNLSATEKAQLIAFLKTLTGPLATAPKWLNAPEGMK
jgi:cytochrome c peroxidase